MHAMTVEEETKEVVVHQAPARAVIPLSRMHMPFDAAAIAMQIGWTPLMRAYFGRAKTALINDIARALSRRLFCLAGSMTDPLDLKGLPFIEYGEVHYAAEAMIKAAVESGDVLIFLDEMTTFPGAVRAVILKMIHERLCGPHPAQQHDVRGCVQRGDRCTERSPARCRKHQPHGRHGHAAADA
jgi:MoxR-like ATPase